MRRFASILGIAAFLMGLCAASTSAASFGLKDLDVTFTDSGGGISMQAGSHPFAATASSAVVTEEDPVTHNPIPVESAKDVRVTLPEGLVGKPGAAEHCSVVEFLAGEASGGECPDASVIGVAEIEYGNSEGPQFDTQPLYNLAPAPGTLAKFGLLIEGGIVPVVADVTLSPNPPYNAIVQAANISQVAFYLSSDITIWGVPADPAHDPERGDCVRTPAADSCPVNVPEVPFALMPTSCRGPLGTRFEADSWQKPGFFVAKTAFTHDEAGEPLGPLGCAKLDFNPQVEAKPTSAAAQSPTGLDLAIDVKDTGILNPNEGATAASTIEALVLTLPQGMSANPSLAEGLAVCSEADLENETAFSDPGAGCPEASKIGTVEVQTPLLEKSLGGSLYVAEPYANLADDSLIALYVVIKDAELGVLVKQTVRVEPDPQTGQLIGIAEDIPQLPFSHFALHFREGGRSPLITPPGCGPHSATATFYPWADGPPVTKTSTFQIVSGPNGAPCSSSAPFAPGFQAGTLNNAAGQFSPFSMRLTRADGEQDMSRLSAKLPPGVIGKIAGAGRCPEAAIALARARTGPHGGQEEREHPACPANSKIGRTLAGAGVGSQLTYVPGSLYLAGPLGGDPLSIVAIVPAVAGPFDAGTVVVRFALTLNPITGEVEVDGAASEPIPHILKGIPLNVRDLRASTDRPEFTLNATDCSEESTRATLWGAGTALFPSAETPVALKDRYQAAGCASLGFKPSLTLSLQGGTRRGDHPALKAVVTPRAGDANFAKAIVTLPRSAFLDQGHIRTICTRVQFAAGAGNGEQCPPAAQYGYVRAWTPLLDEPAQGPVFLRSSNHNLPDFVIALEGPPSAKAEIELSSRIDSHKGGIRSSFEAIPDFPVSRFVLEMQGGRKGLIVNSRNLCAHPSRAKVRLTGQNGRRYDFDPQVKSKSC